MTDYERWAKPPTGSAGSSTGVLPGQSSAPSYATGAAAAPAGAYPQRPYQAYNGGSIYAQQAGGPPVSAPVMSPVTSLYPPPVHLDEPRPRRSRGGTIVAVLIAAILLSGGSAVAGGYVALNLNQAPGLVGTNAPAGTNPAGTNVALSQIAAKVLPSVVSISAGQAIGSGVIITADGAVLTNNHVIANARGNGVTVTFANGQRSQATIVGRDPNSDLAVVRVNGASGLPAMAYGDSSKLRVGDGVLAVGSPLGLQGSVTSGIVSALNRTIETEGSPAIEGAIQTDAAINPGNSGGALINWSGQLVGINTAIASTGEEGGNIGLGFAISSNTAKQVADRLLRG